MNYFVVDAFAERVFEGNPAGVVVLNDWIPDALMQKIASENNLSETAFTVKEDSGYSLRWFAPGSEIDLCGHATLATVYVLLRFFEKDADEILFSTLSGGLRVLKNGDLYAVDMPAYRMKQVHVTEDMALAIGFMPVEAWMGRDLVCVLENEGQVINCNPDGEKVKGLDGLVLHITSNSQQFDCVTRSFAPKVNVAEDPVCGSGHCHVIPLWSKKMGKSDLTAQQASARGGILYCKNRGDRVVVAGKAVLYSVAKLFVDEVPDMTGRMFD